MAAGDEPIVSSETQRLMWRQCDPAELARWVKAHHDVAVHDVEKTAPHLQCSIVGAIQSPVGPLLLPKHDAAASVPPIGSKTITRCLASGTLESGLQVVTPSCRRWRRKRKAFEEKASVFHSIIIKCWMANTMINEFNDAKPMPQPSSVMANC